MATSLKGEFLPEYNKIGARSESGAVYFNCTMRCVTDRRPMVSFT